MAFLKRIKNIKNRFFTQLLAFFAVFFVIMQLLNIYAYYELQRSFERSLATLQAEVSSVISSSVNEIFGQVSQSNYLISLDDSVQTVYSSHVALSETDYYLFPQVIRTLSSVTTYSDFIDGIAIYRRNDGIVISDKAVYSDTDYFTLYHRYENYGLDYWKGVPERWGAFELMAPTKAYSYMNHDSATLLPILCSGVFGTYSSNLFIVDLDYSAVQKMLDCYLSTANSAIYILDGQGGNVLLTSSNAPAISGADLAAPDAQDASQPFRKTIDGEAYIAVSQEERINTQTVTVATLIPYRDISATLRANSWDRWGWSLFLSVAVALLLAVLFTKKAYSPVKQLLQKTNAGGFEMNENEFDVLQSIYFNVEQSLSSAKLQLQNARPIAREQVLRKALLGHKFSESEARYARQLLDADGSQSYQVILFQPVFRQAIYEDFSEEFNANILNMIKAVLTTVFDFCQHWIVEMDGRFFLFIFGDEAKPQERIEKACRQVIEIFRQDDDYIRLLVFIDENSVRLDALAGYYKRALAHISKASLDTESLIIHGGEAGTDRQAALSSAAKSKLINMLAAGKKEEAAQLLDEIIAHYTRQGLSSYDASNMAMQIYFIGTEALFQHELTVDEQATLSFSDFVANLQSKSPDVISTYLHGFIEQIAARCANLTPPLKLQTFSTYLKENFDKDISMDSLADRYHASPQYISRLIKKEVGMTYQSYLNHLRIQKAQELLIHTELSVSEIYERVGYHGRNTFIRTFKAICGVTPSEYRKLHKKED